MYRALFLLLVLALCASPSTRADNGTYNVQFTGTITAETCNVASSSKQQTVALGQFTTTEFASTGTVTKSSPFNINLTDCTPGISGAQVWFTGTQDKDNPALLALSDTGMGAADGMAAGLGVEIMNNDKTPISINNDNSAVYPLKPGDNTLIFALRYKSTRPEITAGNATAVMYFDLQYQ